MPLGFQVATRLVWFMQWTINSCVKLDYFVVALRVVRQSLFMAIVLVAIGPMSSHSSEDLQLVFEVEHWEYDEPSFMQKTSKPPLIGVAVESYGRQGARSLFYSFRGHLGQTNYISDSTGSLDRVPLYRLQFETGLIRPTNQSLDLLYGIGFRWLYDDSGGLLSSTGHAGYDRESSYFYFPVGFRVPLGQGSLRGQYQVFINGNQVSHMADTPGGLSNLANKQAHGYGYELTYHSDQMFGVYVRYWSLGDSSINQYLTDSGPVNGYEPANSTLEFGLRWAFIGFD